MTGCIAIQPRQRHTARPLGLSVPSPEDTAATLRVLLVEDDAEDAALARRALARMPSFRCEVRWAGTFAEAADALRGDDFDLLVLDQRLGACTGLELLADVFGSRPSLPVVLLTGAADRQTDVQASSAGVAALLTKTELTPAALERSVRYALERARAERELESARAFFRAGFDALQEHVAILDAEGTIIEVNAAWTRFAQENGASHPEAWRGANYLAFCDAAAPGDPTAAVAARGLRAVLAGEERVFQLEYPCHAPHAERWFVLRAVPFEGSGRILVHVAHHDVTERKLLETRLMRQAHQDPLTGLANRALFDATLRQVLDERPPQEVAVLLLDLDNFKTVNDSLGHAAGDALLKIVARRLLGATCGPDTVARLGGDEFAIILSGAGRGTAAASVAQRIVAAMRAPMRLAGRAFVVPVSVGIARAGAGETAEDLLRNADVALYRAKGLGKGRCEEFAPELYVAARERLELEADLRRGLSRRELWLAYQPIVELATGRVTGAEALVRWRHPVRGEVPPAAFIPVAEDSGLIVRLGRWVLREACREATRWNACVGACGGACGGAGGACAAAPLRVNVNVSPVQVLEPDFVATVVEILRASGLPASCLVLEITESVMMHHGDAVLERLAALRTLGVQLALDDFGTGFSSLSYLRRFPVDVLKIDRCFVDGLGTDGEVPLATAIIDLASALSLGVIAEGIEHPAQLRRLDALGCTHGQGYLLGRPMSACDMRARLHPETPS